MIYNTEIPKILEQGDICQNLPKVSPTQIDFSDKKNEWIENIYLLKQKELPRKKVSFNVSAIVANGIVISQSCDIRPGSSLLFAELKEGKEPFSSRVDSRIKQIKKIIHDDTRSHYCPPEETIELFKKPKIIDLKSLFLLPFEFLHNNLKDFFVARLISDAKNVLCEKISRFFTRLAFEEIIFLSGDEKAVYLDSLNDEDKKIAIETIEKLGYR